MHELQIATEIIKIVEGEMKKRNLERIKSIGVRMGALSGFNPDALSFSFEAVSQDTPLSGTELDIEFIPVTGECITCGRGFKLEDPIMICPGCGSSKLNISRGEELEISYINKEEADE